MAALLTLQGLVPLLLLYVMKLVIDAVSAAMAAPDREAAFRGVAWLLGCAGVATLASAAIDALSVLVGELHGQAVLDHIQDLLHTKAIEVDLEYFENAEYHNTLHRAQEEALFRPARAARNLVQLGQQGICLLGIAALLVTLHWGVAALLLAVTLPGALVRLRYAKELESWQRQRTLSERLAYYFGSLLTFNLFAKEVRLFDLGPLFKRRARELRRRVRQERHAISRRRALRELAVQTAAILPVFGAYLFIAHETVGGAITLGGLVMYLQAFQRGQGALRSLLNGVAELYENNLFLAHLYEFLDLQRKVVEPANPVPVPRPIRAGILFEGVRFQYAGSERHALEDVTLRIAPGEIVALVGENGSGKTTLVKLLCRLYDPTHGRITVDGIDLCDLETRAWRRQISVLFQDYIRYHLTARENIWLGNLDVSPDDQRIVTAARDAGADRVITRLAHGYDTLLGKGIRDGEELSIGEWQKVALARAFLRDAQVIVLDEPTSALDPKAEAEVFSRFRPLIGRRSAILISHRLSSVRMADRIYVLEEGRIVEGGTHEELLHLGGRYASLYETQARHYR